MAKNLLIEYSVFTPKNTQLTEGIAGGKNMLVEGVVQRAEDVDVGILNQITVCAANGSLK
jgi:hypothetical protein